MNPQDDFTLTLQDVVTTEVDKKTKIKDNFTPKSIEVTASKPLPVEVTYPSFDVLDKLKTSMSSMSNIKTSLSEENKNLYEQLMNNKDEESRVLLKQLLSKLDSNTEQLYQKLFNNLLLINKENLKDKTSKEKLFIDVPFESELFLESTLNLSKLVESGIDTLEFLTKKNMDSTDVLYSLGELIKNFETEKESEDFSKLVKELVTLREVIPNLQKKEGKTEQYVGLVNRQSEVLDEINYKLLIYQEDYKKQNKRVAINSRGVESLLSTQVSLLEQMKQNDEDFLTQLTNKFKKEFPFLTKIGTSSTGVSLFNLAGLALGIPALSKALPAIIKSVPFAFNIIKELGGLVSKTISFGLKAIGNIFGSIRNGFSVLFKGIGNIFGNIRGNFSNLLKGVGNVFGKLGLSELFASTKLLKFAKGIPFLGALITAVTGIYDAIKGWFNASEITGIEGKDLTIVDKFFAMISSVIEGLSFGFLKSEKVYSKLFGEGGMFTGLINTLESFGEKLIPIVSKLASWGVDNIILPVINQLTDLITNIFGEDGILVKTVNILSRLSDEATNLFTKIPIIGDWFETPTTQVKPESKKIEVVTPKVEPTIINKNVGKQVKEEYDFDREYKRKVVTNTQKMTLPQFEMNQSQARSAPLRNISVIDDTGLAIINSSYLDN